MIPEVFKFWQLNSGWAEAYPVFLVVLIAAYLLGSIPFGMVVARFMRLGNLREIGSGNIGATNVLRTGSKTAALLTVVLDGGKGAVAVLVVHQIYGPDAAQIAALGAFTGHIFPIYLKFKGGKGVATFLGILLAIHFWAGLAVCLTWLATALVFRISSLAALVCALCAPAWLWVFGMLPTTGLASVLAILIFLRHRENINRLFKGAEPKIGKK